MTLLPGRPRRRSTPPESPGARSHSPSTSTLLRSLHSDLLIRRMMCRSKRRARPSAPTGRTTTGMDALTPPTPAAAPAAMTLSRPIHAGTWLHRRLLRHRRLPRLPCPRLLLLRSHRPLRRPRSASRHLARLVNRATGASPTAAGTTSRRNLRSIRKMNDARYTERQTVVVYSKGLLLISTCEIDRALTCGASSREVCR